MTRSQDPASSCSASRAPARARRRRCSREHYGVTHLSTGELFRAAVAQGTPAGLEAKAFMDPGELVPDEIVIAVVDERFAEGGRSSDGFILDGFPRTLAQAEELDARPRTNHPLDLVLDLEVPDRGRSSTASPAAGCARSAARPTT